MTSGARKLQVLEPAPQYLILPPLVVDCSALAGVLFQEDWHREAEARLSGYRLFAPYLLESEICSVALKKARRGAEPAAREGLQQWAALDIELRPTALQQVGELARTYRLSAYDAAYLWLAADLKCPLATFDEKLANAARTHLARLD